MSSRPKVFRDPVHANLEFSRDEPADQLALRLIESGPVQRLRRVRQLGLAGLVYHGAEHSRFVHTLGVAHLAKRLYSAACRNAQRQTQQREQLTVVAAAILHDTGHPPFSHAVEKELGVRHEKATVSILRGDPAVNGALMDFGGQELVDAVADHIEGSSDVPTVDLISSQLDADRLDYVLRDGYYAGVPNAQYDLERIVQMAILDDRGLLFDVKAQYAIEGYFLARYHLYLQLYYHRTVRTAEVVLRSLIRAARASVERGDRLGSVHPTLLRLFKEKRIEDSVLVCDADMWSAFSVWRDEAQCPIVKDLSRRLLDRDLFRAIEVEGRQFTTFLLNWFPAIQELAASAGLDPNFYVVMDSASDTPYKVAEFSADTSVRVLDSPGRPKPLENVSPVVDSLKHAAYEKLRCCVPVEIRDKALELMKK